MRTANFKFVYKMPAMHSALNEYIHCTFRGILRRNGALSAMKTAGAYYC